MRPLSDPPAPTDRQGRSDRAPTDGEAKGRARRAPTARSLSEDALADATLRIIDNRATYRGPKVVVTMREVHLAEHLM